MSILSLQESSALSERADRLGRIVEEHAGPLRENALGRCFRLEGVRFHRFRSDRNTIYRVNDGQRWFLKMPRNPCSEAVRREMIGARAVCECLADSTSYRHPALVRTSTQFGYVLTSNLGGRMIGRELYRSLLFPLLWSQSRLHEAFRHLGKAVARLHGFRPAEHVTLSRTALAALRNELRRVSRPDRQCQLIQDRIQNASPFATGCFAHGNLSLENVIVSKRNVSLVDFENCGTGSPYDDLSLICGQLAVTATAVHLPAEPTLAARDAFLEGYRRQAEFEPDLLGRAITWRLCHYYVYNFCGDRPRPTLAGLPVLRGRIRRLIAKSLDERPAAWPQEAGPRQPSC